MISLKEVDSKNVFDIVNLKVKKDQENFVASNSASIIEAYVTVKANGIALPFGIYDNLTLIGFVMLGYGNEPDEDNPKIAKDNYCIWRFMIDEKYQGNGYSKEALKVILDYIKTFPAGKAKYCWLSYEKENIVAEKLYKSFDFLPNGEVEEDEIVAVLKL